MVAVVVVLMGRWQAVTGSRSAGARQWALEADNRRAQTNFDFLFNFSKTDSNLPSRPPNIMTNSNVIDKMKRNNFLH
jgi:hypothetical protein